MARPNEVAPPSGSSEKSVTSRQIARAAPIAPSGIQLSSKSRQADVAMLDPPVRGLWAAFLNIGRTGGVTGCWRRSARRPQGRDPTGVAARRDLAYVRAEQLFGSKNAADSSLTPTPHTAADDRRGRGIRGFRDGHARALGLLRH